MFGYKLELYWAPKPDCHECRRKKFALLDLDGFIFNNKPEKYRRPTILLDFAYLRRHEIGCYIFITLFRQQLIFHARKVVKEYTKEELIGPK